MKHKIVLSPQVQPIFLAYYVVFVVLPFVYGVFFSDFRLHLPLFGHGYVVSRLNVLIMGAFALGLWGFYNMEKSRFPNIRMQAWTYMLSAVVGVVIYVVLLGPAQTLTSLAVFAVVQIMAILVSFVWESIWTNKIWRGKGRTYTNLKELLGSILYGLAFLAYPMYIFFETIPDGGTMRIVFIIYSSGLFVWEIVRAYRFNLLKGRRN